MTTVQSTLLDSSGSPVANSAVSVQLGGVSNGRFFPVSGWGPGGEVVTSVTVTTNGAGVWTTTLVPNGSITPANTVYQITQQVNGEKLWIIVPDSTQTLQAQALQVSQPQSLDVTAAQLAVTAAASVKPGVAGGIAELNASGQVEDAAGRPQTPQTRSGADLLSQHVPLGGVRIDPTQVYAAHATSVCVTPTYDGSGQTVEPCVKYFPLGWNGFKYWMAVSAFPGGASTYENPSILCSNDGDTWQVPSGLTNPIDQPGVAGQAYVDASLVMVDETMWCVYNMGPFYAKYSTDGVTWSARQTLTLDVVHGGAGPSIVRRGDSYYLWFTDQSGVGSPWIKRLYISTTGMSGTFVYQGDCTFDAIPGRDLWEQNMILVGDQFVSAWEMCAAGTTGAQCLLHLATSDDGLAWDLNPAPLLGLGPTGGIDDYQIYRSTIVPLDGRNGELFDLWYGAAAGSNTSSTWHVARTTVVYAPQKTAVTSILSPQLVGRWYVPPQTNLQRTLAQTVGQLVLAPCFTETPITIDQLAVNVTGTAVTGASMRLGIYVPLYPQTPWTGPGGPGGSTAPTCVLLLDAGLLDCSATGVKTLTLTTPQVIPAGWFWIGGAAQTASPTVYCAGSGTGVPYWSMLGLGGGGMSGSPFLAVYQSGVTGALPATVYGSPIPYDSGVTYHRSA